MSIETKVRRLEREVIGQQVRDLLAVVRGYRWSVRREYIESVLDRFGEEVSQVEFDWPGTLIDVGRTPYGGDPGGEFCDLGERVVVVSGGAERMLRRVGGRAGRLRFEVAA